MENKKGKRKLTLEKIKVTELNNEYLYEIKGGNTADSVGVGCLKQSKRFMCNSETDLIFR